MNFQGHYIFIIWMHHNRWSLIDIGIIAPTKHNKKFKRKYQLKKELLCRINDLILDLYESNSKINKLNEELKTTSNTYEVKLSKYRQKILKMYDIVRDYDYEVYYKLRDLE